MPATFHRLARDVRDAAGAAALSLGIFGAPVALAVLQLDYVPGLDTVLVASPQRTASVVYLPPPAADDADDGLAEAPEPEPQPRPEPEPQPPPEPEPASPPEAAAPEAPPPDPPGADKLALPGEPALHVALAPPHRRIASSRIVDPRTLRGENAARASNSEGGGGKARGRRCEDATGSIRAVEAGYYEIDRSLVDMYVNDLELAQTLASVAWHRDEQGKIDGFRIRRIRCGTVLDQAGFENGDVVHSVNGKKIRTVFGAISAYRKLKRKEHLRVELTRRDGSSRSLRYRVS